MVVNAGIETRSIRVLLIDGDRETAAIVRSYLKASRNGFEPLQWARSYRKGWERLLEPDVDVVLLAHFLDGGTCLDLLAELPRIASRVPVLVLTSCSAAELGRDAFAHGVSDCIEKSTLTPALLERAIYYAVSTFRNQQRLLESQQELQRLSSELALRATQHVDVQERSSRDMERFATLVAHDIQAPLRVVSTHIRELRSHGNGSNQEEDSLKLHFLDQALNGVDRVQDLVRSVLGYARLSAKRMTKGYVDLGAVLGSVLDEMKAEFDAEDAWVFAGPMPHVRGDAALLAGLFRNLLGNALKYRREAPLWIIVAAAGVGPEWVISVTDNGAGFPRRERERIFSMFHRGAGAASRPGTGLGLAACKKIAELHGGRIWASSEPGQGATFSFTLPRAERGVLVHLSPEE